jgi:hypothetical protein
VRDGERYTAAGDSNAAAGTRASADTGAPSVTGEAAGDAR